MAPHQFGTPLSEKDFEALERGGIPRERAQVLPWHRVNSTEGAQIVGRNGANANYAGISIGNYLPGQDAPRSLRVRRDQPDLEQKSDGTVKEKAKYLGAKGDRPRAYFAYGTPPELLEDISFPIVICEGEKKCESLWCVAWHGLSDAADRPRFLPVAITGVWCFRGKIGIRDGPHGERQDVKGVIDDFNRIKWTGRRVVILFDADIHNDDGKPGGLKHARNTLAKELRGRGAHVLFAEIPADLDGGR